MAQSGSPGALRIATGALVGALVDAFASTALKAARAIDGGRPVVAAAGLLLADLKAIDTVALGIAVGALISAGIDALSAAAVETIRTIDGGGPVEATIGMLLADLKAIDTVALDVTVGALIGTGIDALTLFAIHIARAVLWRRPVQTTRRLFFTDLIVIAARALGITGCALVGAILGALSAGADLACVFTTPGRRPLGAAVGPFFTDAIVVAGALPLTRCTRSVALVDALTVDATFVVVALAGVGPIRTAGDVDAVLQALLTAPSIADRAGGVAGFDASPLFATRSFVTLGRTAPIGTSVDGHTQPNAIFCALHIAECADLLTALLVGAGVGRGILVATAGGEQQRTPDGRDESK